MVKYKETNNFTKKQILEIIKQLGIKEGQIKGEWYNTSCPLPEHEDKNPSFGINIENGGYFRCFVCGGGNLEQLAYRLGFKIDKKWKNIELDSLFDIDEKEEKIIDINSELLEVKFPFTIKGSPKFIIDRGFDKNTISKWEFYINNDTGSLILPIRDCNKRIVGWVSRRPNGIEPRYLYSPVGFEKSKVLYGEYLLRQNQNFVCICEGSLNSIWLDYHGYNSIALLGKDLSPTQQRRLINLRKGEYIICLDNDEAGRKGIYGYRDEQNYYHPGFIVKMKQYGLLSIIELPKDKKDVQDVRDSKQLIDIIENRKLVY